MASRRGGIGAPIGAGRRRPGEGGRTTLRAASGTTCARGIENINGSPQGDILVGNKRANEIRGLAGDDILDGGTGVDRLIGGTGTDTCVAGEELSSCEK
jgi:hypothetical protein